VPNGLPGQDTVPARIGEAFLKTCQGWQELIVKLLNIKNITKVYIGEIDFFIF
jgi:hypothetical protein